MEDAADWFDATDVLSAEEKRKIGRNNAVRLFNLNVSKN
jgi:predicted TIM-barrel fold metal-dependent hydrolase